MSSPIRVVVVDDHRIVREGLRAMLNAVPEIEIVGEAEDLDGALDAIASGRPDVVLLDVRLRRASGLDACRAITKHHPDVKVVFLTVFTCETELAACNGGVDLCHHVNRSNPERIGWR